MAPRVYLQNNYDDWRDLGYLLPVFFFLSTYNIPRVTGTEKADGDLKQLMTEIPLGINLVVGSSVCIGLGLSMGA